ncbi:leucine-rich repeat-containing protein 48-like [Fopius arisanus]|uniref:Dynein axonemal assembly factor 1 homolog n=1 Tax=Fopius arisanus TaxID=64838 RepID=A0A9R1T792_9HYME|nr:PREDICTED: leucine-rich repeat-containing protein 48-like [Fopius arisanus]
MEEQETESLKYGIINYKLLEELAIQQAPKGEAGRLFREDGVKLEEVKELRIEFLNIISLEHLWPMKSIRKLTLSHNCIERIEKLEDLVELRELDLSFNRISLMEGLSHLINLEILILSGNDIQNIEGIDGLDNLKILSLANNKINSWDHVMYLRKFKELRSLNIQGNPCMYQKGFIDYIIAFVPQLVYFSYRMITGEQRNKSREIHRLSVAKTEESETNLHRSQSKTKAVEDKKAKDFEAFVENFDANEFLNFLCEKDKENSILKKVHLIAEKSYEKYSTKINEISREIYRFGNNKKAERSKELAIFRKTIEDEQNSVKFTARRLMDEIEERRNEILEDLKKKSSINDANDADCESSGKVPEDSLSIDLRETQKIAEEFNKFMSSKWTKLMYNEIVLHEQMEDVLESFKNNMSKAITEFTDFMKEAFSQIKNTEDDYCKNINSIINSYVANMNSDEAVIPEGFREILENSESLNENLVSSHELRLNLIASKEQTMIKRIESWLEDLIDELESHENSRHRSRILEISHFIQFQRESLEDVFDMNINIDKNIEADVAAALDD